MLQGADVGSLQSSVGGVSLGPAGDTRRSGPDARCMLISSKER